MGYEGDINPLAALALAAGLVVAQQPAPIAGTATFDQSDRACGQPATFHDTFHVWVALDPATGTAVLQIDQPSTGSVVRGALAPDGTFADVGNDAEHYAGRASGAAIEASYTYTNGGCTQTWAAHFTLAAPIVVPAAPPPPAPATTATPTTSPVSLLPATRAVPGRNEGGSPGVVLGIALEVAAVVLLWVGRGGRPGRLRRLFPIRSAR